MSISIIIPVLDEATGISACLDSLLACADGDRPKIATTPEIIVVDGGSTDDTPKIVANYPVKFLRAPTGRGQQMNGGAAIATGEVLLFLHSDTVLPPNFASLIETTLTNAGNIAGAFQLHIDDPQPSLRWIEKAVQWRSQYLSLPYGDQAIFVRTEVFRELGGYAELPIMEDYEFVHRLKQRGAIALVDAAVKTSARRWQKLGVWRTTLTNQMMILGFKLGINPVTLRHWYRQQARR